MNMRNEYNDALIRHGIDPSTTLYWRMTKDHYYELGGLGNPTLFRRSDDKGTSTYWGFINPFDYNELCRQN